MAYSQESQIFRAADAMRAAGLEPTALQRYMQRGYFPMQPCDTPSHGSGDNRGYSFRRVIQIALTADLVSLGIAPSRAAKAAFQFSDMGNPGRAAGELHKLGTTYLVGLPRGENRVVNIPPDLSIADVLSNDSAAFIINCNHVIAKVTEQLETK